MKKSLTLLALAGVFSATPMLSFAQTDDSTTVQEQNKYQVVTNRFCDNWFISGGVGASVMIGDNDGAGDFGKRISPTINIGVGKWFTPGLGLRLQYSGLQAKGWTNQANAYTHGAPNAEGYSKQRINYMNLHGDVMFNLNALIGGYNPDRVYEVIPYLGAGFTHTYSKPHRQGFAMNAGIINRFRLSDAVDLNIELSATGVQDKFDGESNNGHDFDGIVNLTAGVTYRFKTRGFKRPAPQLISAAELADMQAKIAKMSAENAEMQNALNEANNRPAETKEIRVPSDIAPRTVFFKIGSSKVSPREEMNLKYLAEQMNQFPETTYTLNGYADSDTGSAKYNETLSLKRAQAVADVLVNKYNVSADRLKVTGNGGVNTFGQSILNRVVLIQSNSNK